MALNPQIVIRDGFKAMPSYSITPMEMVTIALKMGVKPWDKCRMAAMKRRMGEHAVIGDCGIRVEMDPPESARPPEGWLREFCPKAAMDRALKLVHE